MENLEVPPSCWGCGPDYLHRWSFEDLAYDEDKGYICPDCCEEIGEENINFAPRPDRKPSDDMVNVADLLRRQEQ